MRGDRKQANCVIHTLVAQCDAVPMRFPCFHALKRFAPRQVGYCDFSVWGFDCDLFGDAGSFKRSPRLPLGVRAMLRVNYCTISSAVETDETQLVKRKIRELYS